MDQVNGRRGCSGRFAGGGSNKMIGSTDNLFMALMPFVYIYGLILGLIMSLSLSPILALNDGRFEHVSVENAGSESPLLLSSSSSLLMKTFTLLPPPPLRATLLIDHSSLYEVVVGRAGKGMGTREFTALPPPPSPSSSMVHLLRLILEGLNLIFIFGVWDLGDANANADVVSLSLPFLSTLKFLLPSTSTSSSYSQRRALSIRIKSDSDD